MIPIEKVQDIIAKHNNLEKDLKLLSDSGYRIIEKYENQEK